MKIETPHTVGEVIRDRYMGKNGMSESECAQRLGLSQESLARTLKGESYITASMAATLAGQLGMSPEDWLRIERRRIEWEELSEQPRHPGAFLREQVLEASGLSVDALARHLGMAAEALQPILKEESPFTPELAWRLSLALGDSPQAWMALQARYDLIIARCNVDPESISPLTFPEEDYSEDSL